MGEPWPRSRPSGPSESGRGKDEAVGREVVHVTQGAGDLDTVVIGGVSAMHAREHGIRTAVVRS